jgi:hypothetical protein
MTYAQGTSDFSGFCYLRDIICNGYKRMFSISASISVYLNFWNPQQILSAHLSFNFLSILCVSYNLMNFQVCASDIPLISWLDL